MNVMLAEDIGGWLVAAAALFGGLAASVLALVALVPAFKRNLPLTLVLCAPALLLGIVVTGWLGYGFLSSGPPDSDFDFGQDLFMPWAVMAGPSLVTSLLAMTVLWYNRTKAPHSDR